MDWQAYSDTLTPIGILDYLIIGLYGLFILGYGVYKARTVKTSEDYLVAGRGLGLFVLVGTLVMTELNTAAVVGWSPFGYSAGPWALVLPLCFVVGLGAYTVLVAKRWKRLDATSISEMAEARFGPKLRALVAVLSIFSLCLYGPAYLKAASTMFSIALGDFELQYVGITTTVLCISVLIFTLAGGLVSVVWTDLASFLITIVTVPVLVVVCWVKGGGISGLQAAYPPEALSFNPAAHMADPTVPVTFVIALYGLLFLIYCQAPWYGQRMFAAKNPKTAYSGMAIATVLIVLLYGAYLLVCAMARAGFTAEGLPPLPASEQEKVLGLAIVHWMPPVMKGLMLAMIFAVCQTTLSSIWNVNVSMMSQDLYRGFFKRDATDGQVLKFSRLITVVVAGITIYLSLVGSRVLGLLFLANVFTVALFFVVVAGFLWWGATSRGTWITTGLSILVGFWIIYFKSNEAGIQTVNLFGLKIWEGPLASEPWMFALCILVMPVVVIIGVGICLFDKEDDTAIAKRIAFFDRCGAPLFGKRAYEAAKRRLTPGNGAVVK
ncbi:MAG: sodium:solute symporter family protein [Sumerlaeia bacterium]